MEKAIVFFGLGISFILFPAIALMFCSMFKTETNKNRMSVYGDSLFGWISFYNGRNFLYGKIYKMRKFIEFLLENKAINKTDKDMEK